MAVPRTSMTDFFGWLMGQWRRTAGSARRSRARLLGTGRLRVVVPRRPCTIDLDFFRTMHGGNAARKSALRTVATRATPGAPPPPDLRAVRTSDGGLLPRLPLPCARTKKAKCYA